MESTSAAGPPLVMRPYQTYSSVRTSTPTRCAASLSTRQAVAVAPPPSAQPLGCSGSWAVAAPIRVAAPQPRQRMVSRPSMHAGSTTPSMGGAPPLTPRASVVTTSQPVPVASCPAAVMPTSLSTSVTVIAQGQQLLAPLVAQPQPMPPMRLTEGLPDIDSIAEQRDAYLRALEEQEQQALAALEQQRQEQVNAIRIVGEQRKAAFSLEVDRQVQHHDLATAQQHNEHRMLLNQRYAHQRGQLEHQANSLVMEFQHKKAHEEMLMSQYALQRQMHDTTKLYDDDLNRIKSVYQPPPVALGATYTPPMLTSYRSSSYTPSYVPVAPPQYVHA